MSRPRFQGFRNAVAHAFSTSPRPLSDEERIQIDQLAESIERRGMTTAALAALETTRPVAAVAGHSLTFAGPVLTPLFQAVRQDVDVETMAQLLRNRLTFEYLIDRLEADQDSSSPRSEVRPNHQ